jgi:hypothetical protein
MKKKRLYSFYCLPCDNAWLEIKDHSTDTKYDECEYCRSKIRGEIVPDKL